MKAAESRMMASRTAAGHSVWRVMKLSIKPAKQNNGTVPTTIFNPRLAPRWKEWSRL